MAEINIEEITPQINVDTATRTYHLPIATETTLGGIKVGQHLSIEDDGTLNADEIPYTLPTATSETLGGIKVGNGLSINNAALSVVVDSSLSNSSTNPVQNSVINSALGTLTSTTQTISGNLGTLSTTVGNLSTAVGTNTTNISTLTNTVTNLGNTVSTNTDNISTNTNSISALSGSLDGVADRVTTCESDISDLVSGSETLSGRVDVLATKVSNAITYSYLLPVSTWTSGQITLERRGKIGVISIDIAGSLTLTHNTPSTIYTFLENVPYSDSYGLLCSDDGVVVAKIDDQGEFTIESIDGNKNITKLQGAIVVAYE